MPEQEKKAIRVTLGKQLDEIEHANHLIKVITRTGDEEKKFGQGQS